MDQELHQRLRAGVPRLRDDDDVAIATRATQADARVCSAREYGFRTWAELAEATDRARRTHYSRLPPELPWKQAEAAIRAGDAERLRSLLDRHPGLEREDPGMTLLAAAAQPEAGSVPREVATCSSRPAPRWMTRSASPPASTSRTWSAGSWTPRHPASRRSRAPPTTAAVPPRRRCPSARTSRMSAGPAVPSGTTRRTCSPRAWPSRPTWAERPPASSCWITGPTPRVPHSTG